MGDSVLDKSLNRTTPDATGRRPFYAARLRCYEIILGSDLDIILRFKIPIRNNPYSR
jgi:hypothetical protein